MSLFVSPASRRLLLFSSGIIVFCVLYAGWFIYAEIYREEAIPADHIVFTVGQGQSASTLAKQLEAVGYVRNAFLFKRYLVWKGIDKQIQPGTVTVEKPITLARVAMALATAGQRAEREITVIPGWDLRDIADYFEKEGIATAEELYALTGEPAKRPTTVAFESVYTVLADRPPDVSLEGYLAPDTYRIFTDEDLSTTINRLVRHRDEQIDDEIRHGIFESGRTFHEIITMAGLLEREVPHGSDMAKVADLFWRRYDAGWGLQADSTVHYAVGKKGYIFTTKEDRESSNPWNTYKYAGLPPGPISNPSLEAITAAVYPEKNNFWFFLTTPDGEVKYARDLEEHNVNVQRYLR